MGIFSIANTQMVQEPQEIPDNDVPDVHLYYCSTESEINNAVANIGNGSGTIIIIKNITLSAPITLSSGLYHVIQGVSPNITIDCGGDREAFNFQGVKSCILKDLTIDASKIVNNSESALRIMDSSARVENVRILGDRDKKGIGIQVIQSEAWISSCYVSEMYHGIYTCQKSHSIHIIENIINNCSSIGINLRESSEIFCLGNQILSGVGSGISVRSNCESIVIIDNTINNSLSVAITLAQCHDITCVGNQISSGKNGIYTSIDSSSIDIIDNSVKDCSGTGINIRGGSMGVNCEGNTVARCKYGVLVYPCSAIHINYNTITNCVDGIYIIDSTQITCEGNYITNCERGVEITGVCQIININDNTITSCSYVGIRVIDKSEIKCKGNYITQCSRGIELDSTGELCVIADNYLSLNINYGIDTHYANNSIISGNIIADFSQPNSNPYFYGIYLSSSKDIIIINNYISYLHSGIYIDSYTEDTTIISNSLLHNNYQILDHGMNTIESGNVIG